MSSNCPPPNYRTVRRRLEALDARQIVQKREGVKAARAQFGPVKESTLKGLLPLELVQIDHTLADVAKRKQPIRHPADPDEFFLDFLPAVPRLAFTSTRFGTGQVY
jgi:hypothetical protein